MTAVHALLGQVLKGDPNERPYCASVLLGSVRLLRGGGGVVDERRAMQLPEKLAGRLGQEYEEPVEMFLPTFFCQFPVVCCFLRALTRHRFHEP